MFWMVEVMESWFLADVAALKVYYGDSFQENVVRGNPEVEKILRTDVYSRLKRATKTRNLVNITKPNTRRLSSQRLMSASYEPQRPTVSACFASCWESLQRTDLLLRSGWPLVFYRRVIPV